MNSPFKFLDAYTPADRDFFFGREKEMETIYNLIYKSRLLLLYGQSGTGKTSLIQCGLGARFDLTDWYPFHLRRNDDINQSLALALAAQNGGQLRKGSITETIAQLYKTFLRPIYLIFDQLEELFILGNEEEQDIFIQTINTILQSQQPCKIILVMREEYIAHLYHFEQTIPTLFDRRLRVEPMNYSNVAQVIKGSCQAFNITLESPEDNIRQIIDKISRGKSGVQLPYLQVYLDRLWREDFVRTYPEGIPPEALPGPGQYPALQFLGKEIAELGDIEDVLEEFLRHQAHHLQQELLTTWPQLPPDAIRQILDIFVTSEGTKRPILYKRVDGQIVLSEKIATQLAHLPLAAVREALEKLEHLRILRFSEKQIELAHDSLAHLIDRDRSHEQRQLNLVKRRLAASFLENQETGEYLTSKQLDSLEPYMPRLALEPHLHDFIQNSYADVERRKKEEDERLRHEMRLKAQKRSHQIATWRTRLWLAISLGIVIYLYDKTVEAKKQDAAYYAQFQQEQVDKISRSIHEICEKAIILRSQGELVKSDSLLYAAQQLVNQYPGFKQLITQRDSINALINH